MRMMNNINKQILSNSLPYYSILTDILVTFAILITGIVIYPLIAFLFGWLYGAVVSLVFNMVIGISGGLEVTTQDVKAAK